MSAATPALATKVRPETDAATYLCEQYATASTRRQRYLLVHTTREDAHAALVWLLERVLCLIDQLPPECGEQVREAMPGEEDQAVVLDALAAGRQFKLEYHVQRPTGGNAHALEEPTTYVFSIEPQPAAPPPPGTGRHRKGPASNPSGLGASA